MARSVLRYDQYYCDRNGNCNLKSHRFSTVAVTPATGKTGVATFAYLEPDEAPGVTADGTNTNLTPSAIATAPASGKLSITRT